MAKTNAMDIYKADGTTEQVLSEAYAGVLNNFSTRALSSLVKNTVWSGDPKTGSVEFDRILNTAVESYDADATDVKMNISKVTVNVNTPKMIRERVTQWDLDEYGIEGLINRKAEMYANSMEIFGDRAFFAQAESEGVEKTLTDDTARDKLDTLIAGLTDIQNDYADGVDPSQISVFLKTSVWNELQAVFDAYPNPVEGGRTLYNYNGVSIYRNFRQTEDAIAMVNGAGAMPIAPIGTALDKIAGSVEYYLGLYFKYGVKMIMPELVHYASFTSASA